MQQQPGKYLCVDTRKLETETSELDTQAFLDKIQTKFSNKLSVQPDNICKLRTRLAVDFAKELIACSDTMTDSVPKRTKTPIKRQKGKLKPLLGDNSTKKADDLTSFEVQNGSFSTENKRDISFDNLSPMFSQSPDIKMFQAPDTDWKRSSLVDSCDVDEFPTMRDEKNCISFEDRSKEVTSCDAVFGKTMLDSEQFCNNNNNNLKNSPQDNEDLCSQEEFDSKNRNSSYEDIRESTDMEECRKNVSSDEPRKKQTSTFNNVVDEITLATGKAMETSQNLLKNESFRGSDTKRELHVTSQSSNYTASENQVSKAAWSDPDSIHVKDIWQALNNSGYNISRDEISKYKMNTTSVKSRIKSAPVNRTTPNIGKIPIRTKSAFVTHTPPASDHSNEDNDDQLNTIEKTKSIKVKIENCPPFQSNFNVVGVNKPFSVQPRKMKMQLPLTFKINTRPKPGYFFYFSYGLNMNQKRLEIQLKCETGVKYWGILFGFRLIFNKKGSTQSDIAFPNVVIDAGFCVEGCVYELPQHCLQLLDNSIGFPKHYFRIIAPVWICNCEKPDDYGIAQHCAPSVIYIAQSDLVVADPSTLDCSFTLKQCLLGTDILTPNYQNYLKTLR